MSERRSMCVVVREYREGEGEGEEEEGRREERECVTLVGDQLWHALSLRNAKNLIQCTLASNLTIL